MKRVISLLFLVIIASSIIVSADQYVTEASNNYSINIPLNWQKPAKLLLGVNSPTPLNIFIIHGLTWIIILIFIYKMVTFVPLFKNWFAKIIVSLAVMTLISISGGITEVLEWFDSLNALIVKIISVPSYTLVATIILIILILVLFFIFKLVERMRNKEELSRAEQEGREAGLSIGAMKKRLKDMTWSKW